MTLGGLAALLSRAEAASPSANGFAAGSIEKLFLRCSNATRMLAGVPPITYALPARADRRAVSRFLFKSDEL
jgi:hypothetical protein